MEVGPHTVLEARDYLPFLFMARWFTTHPVRRHSDYEFVKDEARCVTKPTKK